MKKFRSALATLIALALVHASVPAPSAFAAALPQPVLPSAAVSLSPAKAVPAAQQVQSSGTASAYALPQTFMPLAPVRAGSGPKASAAFGLRAMGAELSSGAAPESLGRFYTGERGASRAAEPVYAAFTAPAPTLKSVGGKPSAAPAREVPKPFFAMGGMTGAPSGGVIAVIAVVAAAVVGGVWAWLRGKSKNDAFENSKSNQDVIALEKARRDGDGAKLDALSREARARQGRMQERVDYAKSAGTKKIDLGGGKDLSVKEAETYVAFDGLVAARAALNGNAVSKDPAARVGGELPATWQGRLAGLEQAAAQTEDEGALAL